MRPILVELPAKFLFVAAVLAGLVSLAMTLARRPRGGKWSATPWLFLAAAGLILRMQAPRLVPWAGLVQAGWAPLPVHAYGTLLGAALLVGWFLTMRLARQDGINPDDAAAIYVQTVVGALIGARLLFGVVQWRLFLAHPSDLVFMTHGGLVAYGGFIGGVLISWLACARRGLPLLRWADAATPAVVLGTAITRVGCLLYGCDYGTRSALPWAITFPAGSPAWVDHVQSFGLAPGAARSFPVHPTQLYESVGSVVLFGVVMALRRHRGAPGGVFAAWVIGYGLLRPLIEIVRDDDQRGQIGPLSTSQFIGLAAVLLGVLLLRWRSGRMGPAAG